MKSTSNALLSLAGIALVLCILAALSSGLGVRVNLWEFGLGISILKWAAYLVSVPIILCLLSLCVAYVQKTGGISLRHFVVLLVSALIFWLPYQARTEFRKWPTIADASTDMVDAPQFVALVDQRAKSAKNPLEYRGAEASDLQRQYFPQLSTIESSLSPDQVIKKLTNLAKSQGWEIASAENGRLEATETTFWFRFKDDVVVRTRVLANRNTEVDIRSASRVGYLDGGANAKRVLKLMNELEPSN